MAYDDDDDDDGPGFLTVAALLALTAGGAWFLYRTLTGQAQAGTLPGLVNTPDLSLTTDGAAPGPAGSGVPANAPLGIRNNNPGNIKWSSANNWDGQIGQDASGFVIFSDVTYGLRAMFILLKSYAGDISGPYTIQAIGQRWTSGDPTTSQSAWSATVSSVSGFSQTQVLDPNDAGQMQAIVNGIIGAENGTAWSGYYASVVPTAQQMAA